MDGCGYCYIILIFLKRREMYKYIIVKYLNFIDKIFRFGLYKLYVFICKFGVILCSLFVVWVLNVIEFYLIMKWFMYRKFKIFDKNVDICI